MTVDKLAISLPEDLADRIRQEAEAKGTSVSAWIAAAAEAHLRNVGLQGLLHEWDAEYGTPSEQDRTWARSVWPD